MYSPINNVELRMLAWERGYVHVDSSYHLLTEMCTLQARSKLPQSGQANECVQSTSLRGDLEACLPPPPPPPPPGNFGNFVAEIDSRGFWDTSNPNHKLEIMCPMNKNSVQITVYHISTWQKCWSGVLNLP